MAEFSLAQSRKESLVEIKHPIWMHAELALLDSPLVGPLGVMNFAFRFVDSGWKQLH